MQNPRVLLIDYDLQTCKEIKCRLCGENIDVSHLPTVREGLRYGYPQYFLPRH